ncbi:MAG: hypothetical protein WCP54_07650 [Actinomycetes bacterium]
MRLAIALSITIVFTIQKVYVGVTERPDVFGWNLETVLIAMFMPAIVGGVLYWGLGWERFFGKAEVTSTESKGLEEKGDGVTDGGNVKGAERDRKPYIFTVSISRPKVAIGVVFLVLITGYFWLQNREEGRSRAKKWEDAPLRILKSEEEYRVETLCKAVGLKAALEWNGTPIVANAIGDGAEAECKLKYLNRKQ